jgi:ubiquinone/menaquinone biosynthesis C-methylase UbiE
LSVTGAGRRHAAREERVKLDDPTHGLKETDLERVRLTGQSLVDHGAFWDESAVVDTIRAIADSDTSETFETSGVADAKAILDLAPRRAVVLEIGSGVGRIMQHLAEPCAEVHGVDISAEMAARGTKRLGHLPNVTFHHGNGYDLGMFGDETFDVVYSTIVFQHMPKTTAYNYLTEVRRVLKPGGRLRLQVPNLLRDDHFAAFRHFSQPYFVEHPYPMNFYTPSEVVKMLAEAGLSVESLTDDIIVMARKRRKGDPVAVDLSETMAQLPEMAGVLGRLRELEAEVVKMRRVYDNPTVRAARKLRRVLRGRRANPSG